MSNRTPKSEFTSIGCHTMLWDYAKNDYHRWVYEEGIDKILPPIAKDTTTLDYTYEGQENPSKQQGCFWGMNIKCRWKN